MIENKLRSQLDILFVIPIYNDWESVKVLLEKIEKLLRPAYSICYVLVNDSSEQKAKDSYFSELTSSVIELELSCNMGHQKAIAVGLAYIYDHYLTKYNVVMDSDGEDQPEDLRLLLAKTEHFTGVVFAQRAKRNDGLMFRLFYKLYKLLFFLLTGKKINFGNYCLIPGSYLQKMVHVPDIWNHFSGGVIRSGIPYTAVATDRGKRYYGQSKMNFIRLILHGLSAVSVYTDFMAVRLIVLSFFLIVSTISGITAVVFVRLFSNLAIPGWATFTILGLAILLFLAMLLGLFLLFNVLTMKTQKMIIPAKDYMDYIIDEKIFLPHE